MSDYGKRNINDQLPSTFIRPYGHGSPDRGPDPWTAVTLTTRPKDPALWEEWEKQQRAMRRRAAIHTADVVLMAGGTADDLAAYLPMLFTPEELEEMGS